MLARYNGNVVPFANDATSTNRTVFGGTTQSDNIDDNLNADFKKGWEIVGLNDNPTREDFNAMGYTLGALTSYLYQMGIAEYNALQEYKLNGLCLGTNGTIYQSLVDSNIGNALTNVTKWKNVTSSFVDLVNNQTIDGVKTFTSDIRGSITGSCINFGIGTDTVLKETNLNNYLSGGKFITPHSGLSNLPTGWSQARYVIDVSGGNLYISQLLVNPNNGDIATRSYNGLGWSDWKEVVFTVGNQTIAGVKTFSSSPIVPTPTTGTQAVNKDYVDSLLLPIGTILSGYTIFSNCIVAFGGEFNRADYPKLWGYLQANPSLVKTQAQWQSEATVNGGICGYFSSGNGTTTFRVPNLDKAFLRPDSRAIASFQGDAIRNITGTFNTRSGESATGVFTNVPEGSGATNAYTGYKVTFDASNVVPTANENRPKNIAVLPLIVAK